MKKLFGIFEKRDKVRQASKVDIRVENEDSVVENPIENEHVTVAKDNNTVDVAEAENSVDFVEELERMKGKFGRTSEEIEKKKQIFEEDQDDAPAQGGAEYGDGDHQARPSALPDLALPTYTSHTRKENLFRKSLCKQSGCDIELSSPTISNLGFVGSTARGQHLCDGQWAGLSRQYGSQGLHTGRVGQGLAVHTACGEGTETVIGQCVGYVRPYGQ